MTAHWEGRSDLDEPPRRDPSLDEPNLVTLAHRASIESVQKKQSGSGLAQAGEYRAQSRLASARRPLQQQAFAQLYAQTTVAQCRLRAIVVTINEVVGLEYSRTYIRARRFRRRPDHRRLRLRTCGAVEQLCRALPGDDGASKTSKAYRKSYQCAIGQQHAADADRYRRGAGVTEDEHRTDT